MLNLSPRLLWYNPVEHSATALQIILMYPYLCCCCCCCCFLFFAFPIMSCFFLTFLFFLLFCFFEAHLRGLYGMSSSEYRRSFREGSRMIAHASNSKSAQSFMFSEDGKYMLKTAVSPSDKCTFAHIAWQTP